MICTACKKAADQGKPKKHLKCKSFKHGRTHCDCHHRTVGHYVRRDEEKTQDASQP